MVNLRGFVGRVASVHTPRATIREANRLIAREIWPPGTDHLRPKVR
jgi:hypothetical protein